MNLASQTGDDQSDLLFVNFNQDCTYVIVMLQILLSILEFSH